MDAPTLKPAHEIARALSRQEFMRRRQSAWSKCDPSSRMGVDLDNPYEVEQRTMFLDLKITVEIV